MNFILEQIGKFFLMLKNVFKRPQKSGVYWRLLIRELWDLGYGSLGLVAFISLFMGAVTAIQMAQNFRGADIPVPDYYISYATKVVLLLEFAPTMMSLILAGKVGSYIASSIGTMRVTEQIDALEIMGVNTQSFLVMPKLLATLIFNPILVALSYILGLVGGYLVGIATNMWSEADYINGLQIITQDFYYIYALVKTLFFAFIIATVPSFFGYFVKGGSLEVGRSSTTAVVWTSVFIIISNLILTQIMLS